MRNILYDLCFGRILGWECCPARTDENMTINTKIETEKRYFEEKMSLDDVQRFQALENLYMQAHEFDEIDAYIYGLKLGVMLMCAVFTDENSTKCDGV